MKRAFLFSLFICVFVNTYGQDFSGQADSLRKQGLLMPALEKYAMAFQQDASYETSYAIASTCALLWTSQMRDKAFYYLNFA